MQEGAKRLSWHGTMGKYLNITENTAMHHSVLLNFIMSIGNSEMKINLSIQRIAPGTCTAILEVDVYMKWSVMNVQQLYVDVVYTESLHTKCVDCVLVTLNNFHCL